MCVCVGGGGVALNYLHKTSWTACLLNKFFHMQYQNVGIELSIAPSYHKSLFNFHVHAQPKDKMLSFL